MSDSDSRKSEQSSAAPKIPPRPTTKQVTKIPVTEGVIGAISAEQITNIQISNDGPPNSPTVEPRNDNAGGPMAISEHQDRIAPSQSHDGSSPSRGTGFDEAESGG